ncbi:hypothetical protein ACLOJK_016943 [Asimina triloba]
MAGVSDFRASAPKALLGAGERRWGSISSVRSSARSTAVRILRPFEEERLCVRQFAVIDSKMASRRISRPKFSIRMTLVDDRLTVGRDVAKPAGALAYDLVQGALVSVTISLLPFVGRLLVRWSSVMDKSIPDPPTAVLLHGILGSRKNWGSFARRLAKEFPMWQFLLVDLRCHGDSASVRKSSPHTVAAAALDVLKLVGGTTQNDSTGVSWSQLWGQSMVEQAAKPLARPVKVWVLDATPGKVRPGGDGEDHPAELIAFLSSMPMQVSSKREVVQALVQEGFSHDIAQWVVTNLRQTGSHGSSSSLSWGFDLKGIAEMYKSYEETNLWYSNSTLVHNYLVCLTMKIVEDVPRGVHVNFLKAERSLHRWALEDLRRIHAAEELAVEEGAGVEMHVLEDAGHWVHADNPDGLFRILSSSFQRFK